MLLASANRRGRARKRPPRVSLTSYHTRRRCSAGIPVPDGHRIGYLLTRAFPPMRKMKWDYPVLRRLPVLPPACWVARLCRFWVRRPGAILTETRAIFRR